jgi:hypothetical protein
MEYDWNFSLCSHISHRTVIREHTIILESLILANISKWFQNEILVMIHLRHIESRLIIPRYIMSYIFHSIWNSYSLCIRYAMCSRVFLIWFPHRMINLQDQLNWLICSNEYSIFFELIAEQSLATNHAIYLPIVIVLLILFSIMLWIISNVLYLFFWNKYWKHN